MNSQLTRPFLAAAALATAVIMVGGSTALAEQAPPTLRDSKSVTLNGATPAVWAKLGQFQDLTWVPAVKASTATNGNVPGSVRTLDFGGALFTETLVKHSERNHSYTYKINDTAENRKLAPVSDVLATISVKPGASGKSVLTWSFTFHRLDLSATPAAGADDDAARKQIAGTIAMGMSGASALFPAS